MSSKIGCLLGSTLVRSAMLGFLGLLNACSNNDGSHDILNCAEPQQLAVATSGTYRVQESSALTAEVTVTVLSRVGSSSAFEVSIANDGVARSGIFHSVSGACRPPGDPPSTLDLSAAEEQIFLGTGFGLPRPDTNTGVGPPPTGPNCTNTSFAVGSRSLNALRCERTTTLVVNGMPAEFLVVDTIQPSSMSADTIISGFLSRRVTRSPDGAFLAEITLTDFSR